MDKAFSDALDKFKDKSPFVSNIEEDTKDNEDFFHVVYTGPNSQISLVNLNPKEDIGMESHPQDQFFRVEEGEGMCEVDGQKYPLREGDAVLVPGGSKHNVTKLVMSSIGLTSSTGNSNHIINTHCNISDDNGFDSRP